MKRAHSFFLLTWFLFVSPAAHAQLEGTYQVQISKKTEEKQSARWTLAEWFRWKEKQRAMDLWLAKNSHSSPFEFYLESSALNYGRGNGEASSPQTNSNHYSGALAAYAGNAGLRGSYSQSAEEQTTWTGSFNLRLFGRAIQDTHLNLEYGLRGLSINRGTLPAETFQNQYGGGTLSIYLTKFFGIEGTHHRILPANSELNRTLEGELSQGTVFIDFRALRVFGNWHKERRVYRQGNAGTDEYREGFGGGLRLFF